jgi:hypothetical protein
MGLCSRCEWFVIGMSDRHMGPLVERGKLVMRFLGAR